MARAEDWTWGNLWRRQNQRGLTMLADGPVQRPPDWVEFVNEPQTAAELDAIRQSVNRGRPFGEDDWSDEVVQRLGLDSAMRPLGRPRKAVGA